MKSQSWSYREVATVQVAGDFEDHLLAALRRLTAVLDVEGVCDAVLSGVENVFSASASWIMLHDPVLDVLRTVCCHGRAEQAFGGAEIPVTRGVVGRVFASRQIDFVPDAEQEPAWFDRARVRAAGLRTIFVVPLISNEKPIGVLGLESPRFAPGSPPTIGDVKWLEMFAAQAAIGLLNARTYESSQQDRARLRALLRERRVLRQQLVGLKEEVRHAYSFGPIVGDSEGMRQVRADLQQVAGSDVTVLLLGETGTGKELIARAVHERSGRAHRPFVPVNCAALPENLVESEMFGHERGSFTGAHARKAGRFELAHRGTLFLDEIGDLPLNAQAKLLRVLQDGELQRVGSIHPVKVDVRIVAATNHDLAACVADRYVQGGPVLPVGRVPHPDPAASRAPGRHPAARQPSGRAIRATHRQTHRRACGGRADGVAIGTAGRATSANSRTSWSAPSSWPLTASFPPSTSRFTPFSRRRRPPSPRPGTT